MFGLGSALCGNVVWRNGLVPYYVITSRSACFGVSFRNGGEWSRTVQYGPVPYRCGFVQSSAGLVKLCLVL